MCPNSTVMGPNNLNISLLIYENCRTFLTIFKNLGPKRAKQTVNNHNETVSKSEMPSMLNYRCKELQFKFFVRTTLINSRSIMSDYF